MPLCKWGHEKTFYPSRKRQNWVCNACACEAVKRYRRNHRSKINAYKQAYYKTDEGKRQLRVYRKANRGMILQHERNYVIKNPDKVAAKRARRNRRVELATPSWVDAAGLIAKYVTRPIGYHVDHIVPLKAVIVDELGPRRASGLHVPWNLQHLDGAKNCAKRNVISNSIAIMEV